MRLRRRPNGWSITSTSSMNSFAKSRTICRPATTANCPSLPRATWRAIRAYTESRGRLWRIRTADSTRKCCAALWRPISGCNRSRLANSGRWPSRSASCWSKICAGWRNGLYAAGRPATKPTRWPISLLGPGGQSAILRAALRASRKLPWKRAFAVQLVQRLRDLDPKVGPVLLWLDQRLAAAGTSADEIVRAEHQQQGAMSVSVRNIITSMRLISAFDWQEFFESVSLVDEILRNDTQFRRHGFCHARRLPPRD